jgi:outer membrane protein assembly factor BamB
MRAIGFCLSAVVSLVAAGLARAGETSWGYRGPQNNGVYPATGLLKQWPQDGPPLLWKANVGEGYGGATVVDDSVFVAGGLNGQLFVFSLAGKLQQQIPFGSTSWKRFGGTRSTVLVRDGVAIVTRPNAGICGIDLASGQVKWERNAWRDFGSGRGDMGWGYPSTPAVFENHVILNTVSRDDRTPPIVAVDFATGHTVWEAPPGSGKRYSCGDHSASVFVHNGRALNVSPTYRYTLCLDPCTGEIIWEMPDTDPVKGSGKNLTPVYNEGYLLLERSGLIWCGKLNHDGSQFTPLWARPRSGFSQAVVLGKRVYVGGDYAAAVTPADEFEMANGSRPAPLKKPSLPRGSPPLPPLPGGLLCLDADTGELLDFIRMPDGLGHVVAADGMVYAQNFPRSPERNRDSDTGKLGLEMFLIQPTPTGMDIRGRFRLPMTVEDARQVKELEYQANVNPVVAAGRLFIRYGPLWVYDLRAGNKPVPDAGWSIPASGMWDLRLTGFFEEGQELLVTLQVKDNEILNGSAIAPKWNNAIHLVDATGIKMEDGAPSGVLKITLTSDGTKPPPLPPKTAPVPVEVEIRVTRERDRLTGTYHREGKEPGKITGRISP